jgi:hypothetical protein
MQNFIEEAKTSSFWLAVFVLLLYAVSFVYSNTNNIAPAPKNRSNGTRTVEEIISNYTLLQTEEPAWDHTFVSAINPLENNE